MTSNNFSGKLPASTVKGSFRQMFNNVQSFLEALNSHGYSCDRSLAAQLYAAMAAKPTAGFFAFGRAGVGKTFVAETLAKVTNSALVYFQCMPGTREDDLFLKLMPDSKGNVVAYSGPLVKACQLAQQGQKVLLMLDELDKTRPSFDSTLLDFLQSRRINFGDINLSLSQEEADLFTVIIGMNDERELSEPLQRRLPLIEFKPISVGLMKQLLLNKFGSNEEMALLVEPAVQLYHQCLQLDINCGTQVLSQLIEAAALLGEDADWDTLVRQFVTKRDDLHQMLVQYTHQEQDSKDEDVEQEETKPTSLNLAAYEQLAPQAAEASSRQPAMPRLKFVELPEMQLDKTEPQECYGYMPNTPDNYDLVVRATDFSLTQREDKVGCVQATKDYLVFEEPVTFHQLTELSKGNVSEQNLVARETGVKLAAFKEFLRSYPYDWKIVRASENLIVAQSLGGAQLCWQSNGCVELATMGDGCGQYRWSILTNYVSKDEPAYRRFRGDYSEYYVTLGRGLQGIIQLKEVQIESVNSLRAEVAVLLPAKNDPCEYYAYVDDRLRINGLTLDNYYLSDYHTSKRELIEIDGNYWLPISMSAVGKTVGEAVHNVMCAAASHLIRIALQLRALRPQYKAIQALLGDSVDQ